METEPSQHFTISIYNKMNNLIFEREASCTLTEAIILKDESIEFFKQSNEGSIFQPGEWYIRSSMEGSVK